MNHEILMETEVDGAEPYAELLRRVIPAALEAEVIAAVRSAGALLTARGAVHDIRAKSRTDFVTDVDMRVQAMLRSRLDELAPGVQFMGEEQDNAAIDPSRPCWILDPVDGTTNLIRGLNHSAVSLALAEGGRPVFGAVFNPYAGELFTARSGGGAYLNGQPIHVTGTASLSSALVSVGTSPGRREWAGMVFSEMRALYERSLDVRRSGCASLDLCDVACGRLDAYVERWLLPWDYAAGAVIVAEAGGRVTDCANAGLSMVSGGGLLCSNGALHGEVLAVLEQVGLG